MRHDFVSGNYGWCKRCSHKEDHPDHANPPSEHEYVSGNYGWCKICSHREEGHPPRLR